MPEMEMEYGIIPRETAEKLDVLRQLVSTYYGIQKTRISVGLRVSGIVKEYGSSESGKKNAKKKVVKCGCGNIMMCPECESTEALSDKDLSPIERLSDVHDVSEKIEDTCQKHLKPLLKDFQIYTNWLNAKGEDGQYRGVLGVGDVISAGLISGIKHPGRFMGHTKQPPVKVSALWHYCGLHVEDGKAPTRKSGEKVTWNPFMKTLCWKLGESFVKTKGYYRRCYDMFREEEERKSDKGMIKPIENTIGLVPYNEETQKLFMQKFECPACDYRENTYLAKCPDCGRKAQPVITKQRMEKLRNEGYTDLKVRMTNSHIFERAKRKTVKLFLAHLLEVWCKMEGVEIAEPYAQTILGHQDIIEPPMPDENGRI